MKDTVTISLDTYKHMEEKIKNLEQGIADLKVNKEVVTWSRGIFEYSCWFYNPTETSSNLIREMSEISQENIKLRAELKKKSPYTFLRLFGI